MFGEERLLFPAILIAFGHWRTSLRRHVRDIVWYRSPEGLLSPTGRGMRSEGDSHRKQSRQVDRMLAQLSASALDRVIVFNPWQDYGILPFYIVAFRVGTGA